MNIPTQEKGPPSTGIYIGLCQYPPGTTYPVRLSRGGLWYRFDLVGSWLTPGWVTPTPDSQQGLDTWWNHGYNNGPKSSQDVGRSTQREGGALHKRLIQVKSSSGATRPRGDHPGPASCNFLPPPLRGLRRSEWGIHSGMIVFCSQPVGGRLVSSPDWEPFSRRWLLALMRRTHGGGPYR